MKAQKQSRYDLNSLRGASAVKGASVAVANIAALKRRMYIGTMTLGTLVGWLLVPLSLQGNAFERLTILAAAVLWTLLTLLLWRRPGSLRAVEVTVITSIMLLHLGGLGYGLFVEGTRYDPLGYAVGVPLTYIWVFLVFGSRNGLLVSSLFYLTSLGLGLTYFGVMTSPQDAKAAQLGTLTYFYLTSPLYISALFALLYFLERHLKARIEAEAVAHYAYTDTLTGLPNRLLFHDRLKQAFAHAKRSGKGFALFFIDLDRFKLVNDTLGHGAGDALLRALSLRLQGCVRESDTLARISGDEFALITPDLGHGQAVPPLAEKLIAALQAPFEIEGQPLFATASIGVSYYPKDATTPEELLVRADHAMYQAKASGRNSYRLFHEGTPTDASKCHTLEQELQEALAHGELELHYQPIYELGGGKMTGLEALLRWDHPRHGPICPDVFIPLAEETRLIIPLGAWVLGEACRQNRAWQDAGHPAMVMAVNVSAVQFAQPDFTETVLAALEWSGLAAEWLELELTERMVVHEAAVHRLNTLRALGVRISLDDFGRGYSSLSQLQQLPINGFKIDRSFIQNIGVTPMPVENGIVLVKTIMALARALGLRVVAEGIETPEQLHALRDTGCDQVQGFLFAKPLPPGEIEALLGAKEPVAEAVRSARL